MKALEANVRRLRRELGVAEAALREARIAAAPVKVGDVVVGLLGVEYRVTIVEPKSHGLWLTGNPRRKDGTFGTAVRHIYGNWTHD